MVAETLAHDSKYLETASEDDVFMSVKELKAYVEEVEKTHLEKTLEAYEKAQKAKQALIDRLRSNEPIAPERIKAFLARVKAAALSGSNELMIGRFPSELCTDHGRAINQAEEGWPDTLQGLPRQAYEVWRDKLQPRGYRLKAMIVDWPDGMPGDVGMFLWWA